MSAVQSVTVTIVGPTETSMGQITEGHFIMDGDTLVMTFADGNPVHETLFRHKLRDGDNPRAIAGVLTRKVRRHVLGMNETEEAFSRTLDYANAGVA